MTSEPLRQVYETRPFHPFRLGLTDGTRVAVPHPEFMWMPPTSPRTIIVAVSDGPFRFIDLLHVAGIEMGDGTRRRRRRSSGG